MYTDIYAYSMRIHVQWKRELNGSRSGAVCTEEEQKLPEGGSAGEENKNFCTITVCNAMTVTL